MQSNLELPRSVGHKFQPCRLVQHSQKRHKAALRAESALLSRASLSYKDAGVDIDAGSELVKRIQKLNPNIGGFSGMYPFGDSYLVAGTDGVGTKLKLAFDMNKHDTIGIDLVAMSVNDIVTSGAKPMFFLDYYATGKLDVDTAEAVVKGIVEGCRQSDCILMGGETAEMPGFYQKDEYDVAGFAVGSVKKDQVIDGRDIREGDVILGLPSSGVHSNGFSLARKVLQVSGTGLSDTLSWSNKSIGELLLEPTIIYVPEVLKLASSVQLKGLVHITGGGFTENIPRVLPKGLGVRVHRSAWEVPNLFQWMQEAGGVADAEMFRTFNMGVGMVLIVDKQDADRVQQINSSAFVLGSVTAKEGVEIL